MRGERGVGRFYYNHIHNNILYGKFHYLSFCIPFLYSLFNVSSLFSVCFLFFFHISHFHQPYTNIYISIYTPRNITLGFSTPIKYVQRQKRVLAPAAAVIYPLSFPPPPLFHHTFSTFFMLSADVAYLNWNEH